MSDFMIEENPSFIDPKLIIELYCQVGFGTRSDYQTSKVATMFANSSYIAIAKKRNGQLIGCIRILTDNVETTWIAEIIVIPNFQRKGVGQSLLNLVIDRFKTTAIYCETFNKNKDFFLKCGFKVSSNMVVCSRASQIGFPDKT